MTNFNQCDLKIVFKYHRCNDKLINVNVFSQVLKTNLVDNIPLNPLDNNCAIFEKKIYLPTEIVIITSGKNFIEDTKIDAAGNIYEDLAVQIESISLDSFELSEVYLHQRIKILTESGEEHTTSYFGFNGTIVLDFSESNVFLQVLKANTDC